jgi:predicted ATPase
MRPLLGRRALLERLEAEHDARLVTLVGAPGVGKSALLRQWIRELAPRTAQVVAIDPAALARDEAWPSGPTLVWIDDLEPHAAHAATVAAWLRAAPQLRVRISARAPLRLSDEVVVPVPPLDPADAHALLVERVAAAGGATEGLMPLAAALDGLPLVVELIAPHVVALGGAEALARLDDLLRSLDRAARDVDPRHGSWPRALGPSWDSLAAHERVALAECAAFVGRFSLAAAEAVLSPGSPIAPVVETLCERGLLAHGEARYRCLRPIAAYARDQLPPSGVVLERHAAWAITRASADVADELAAVCARALGGEVPWATGAEAALTLAHTLAPVELRERWIEALCASRDATPGDAPTADARILRARLWSARGRVRGERGRFEDARHDLRSALQEVAGLPGCDTIAAAIEDALCTTCRRLRDFDAARAHGERALVLQRASGAPASAELNTLGALAALDVEAGRLDEARAEFEEVRRRARQHGDERAATLAIAYIGHIDHERGRLDVARRTFARVRERFRALGGHAPGPQCSRATRRWSPTSSVSSRRRCACTTRRCARCLRRARTPSRACCWRVPAQRTRPAAPPRRPSRASSGPRRGWTSPVTRRSRWSCAPTGCTWCSPTAARATSWSAPTPRCAPRPLPTWPRPMICASRCASWMGASVDDGTRAPSCS